MKVKVSTTTTITVAKVERGAVILRGENGVEVRLRGGDEYHVTVDLHQNYGRDDRP